MHLSKGLFLRTFRKSCLIFLLLLSFGGTSTAYGQFVWQSGNHNFDGSISKLYVDPLDSTLWVLGGYQQVNGQPAPKGITRINTSGQILNFPDCPYSQNAAIIRWNGSLYVGGGSGLSRYDGNRWYKIDSNRRFGVYSLLPYGNKLLVGGVFLGSTAYENILMAYEPGTDTLVNTFGADTVLPHSDAIYDMAMYKGKLYIGGRFEPYPPLNPGLRMIACWNGTAWEDVQGGIPESINGTSDDFVGGLEVYNDTLFVAGHFEQYLGAPGNSIAKWDGQNWHPVGQGTETGGFQKLKTYKGGLVAMGRFAEIDRYSCSSIGIYKNGQWCRNTSLTNNVLSGVDFAGDFWVATGKVVGHETVHYLAKITNMGSCIPAGVETPFSNATAVTISPNPSAGNFILRRQGGNQSTLLTCRATDLTGRMLWETKSTASELHIEAAQWPAGMYLLYLQGPDGTMQVEKLVKK